MGSFRAEIKSAFEELDRSIPANDVLSNIGIITGLVEETRSQVSPILLDHIQRTAKIAERLGRAAGFPIILKNILVLLAKAHDIGKREFPHLLETYPLSPAQTAEYRGHVEASVRLLENLHGNHGEIIRASVGDHHERPHGQGYPNRKRGTDLSRLTVMFVILDVFATIVWPPRVSPRYQIHPQDRLRHLISELRKGEKDQEFDRGACDLFFKIFHQGAFDEMEIEYNGVSYRIADFSKEELFAAS